MMIKGSLVFSIPIVKRFQAKKNKSTFGPNFDDFWEQKRLNIT